MSKAPLINIEVVYATAQHYTIIPLQVTMGTSIQQAIEYSGLLQIYPEIQLDTAKSPYNCVGDFSVIKNLEDKVEKNSRVEIYRPLTQSAEQLRKSRIKPKINRQRAAKRPE